MNGQDGTRFGLVFLLWAAGLCAAAQFAKMAVVFPTLQEHYPGAGAEVGFLISIISFLGILLGTSAGMVIARLGFRRLLLWALVLGGAVSAYQATLPPFGMMMASRFVEGISHLIIVVAAPTLIAQFSAERHRPYTLTLWGTFFGVAFSLAAWLGIPLVSTHGLHMMFIAHAAAISVVALLLYFWLPTVLPADAEPTLPGIVHIIKQHAAIYRSPHMAAPALGWLFYTFSFVSLLTLLPDTVAAESRTFVAASMPLASIISSMTVGMAMLRFTSAVNVVLVGFAIALGIAFALWLDPGNAWLCILLFGALGLVQGASFAAVPQLNQTPQTQAMANGAMAQTGNLGNTCGTPVTLAILVSFGYDGMILVIMLCYVLGISVHYLLERWRRPGQLQSSG